MHIHLDHMLSISAALRHVCVCLCVHSSVYECLHICIYPHIYTHTYVHVTHTHNHFLAPPHSLSLLHAHIFLFPSPPHSLSLSHTSTIWGRETRQLYVNKKTKSLTHRRLSKFAQRRHSISQENSCWRSQTRWRK